MLDQLTNHPQHNQAPRRPRDGSKPIAPHQSAMHQRIIRQNHRCMLRDLDGISRQPNREEQQNPSQTAIESTASGRYQNNKTAENNSVAINGNTIQVVKR